MFLFSRNSNFDLIDYRVKPDNDRERKPMMTKHNVILVLDFYCN